MKAKYPTPSFEPEPAPEPVTPKVMTLQEAAGAFRPMLNGWRGMVRMGEAIDAALTAESRLRQAEQERERALSDLAKVGADRALADEGLALARQGLTGVQDATRLAREELETVRRQIRDEQAVETRRQADVKRAWEAERQTAEREINETKGRLDKIRAELATVVKQHTA